MNVQFLCEQQSYIRKDSIGNIYNQTNFLNEIAVKVPSLKIFSWLFISAELAM